MYSLIFMLYEEYFESYEIEQLWRKAYCYFWSQHFSIFQVMYRKGEFNAIEKERKKNRETLSMLMPNATVIFIDFFKDYYSFFQNFCRPKIAPSGSPICLEANR